MQIFQINHNKMAWIKRRICYEHYKLNKYKKYKQNNKTKPIIKRRASSKINNLFVKNIQTIYRSSFNQLHFEKQQEELLNIRRDIKNIAQKILEKKAESKIFRPYLPNKIWRKMSWFKKQAHLKKRRYMVENKIRFIKPKKSTTLYKSKIYFTNANKRQFLKLLHPLIKAVYLKNIIQKAVKCDVNRDLFINPSKKVPISTLNIQNFYAKISKKRHFRIKYKKIYAKH